MIKKLLRGSLAVLFSSVFPIFYTQSLSAAGPRDGSSSALFLFSDSSGRTSRRKAALDIVPFSSAYKGRLFTVSAGFSRLVSGGNSGAVPENLYASDLTFSVADKLRRLEITVGSASDRLFYSGSEIYAGFNLTGELRRTGSGKGVWLWGVAYSGGPGVFSGFPTPFVAYRYVSDSFILNLPFSALWKPDGSFILSAGWKPLRYYSVSAVYRPFPALRFSAELASGAERYYPAGREDEAEALYIETLRLVFSAGFDFRPGTSLNIFAGRQLDGSVYYGRDYGDYKKKESDGAGLYSGFSLNQRF